MIDFSDTPLQISGCIFDSNINSPIHTIRSNLTIENLTILNSFCSSLQLGCVISSKESSIIIVNFLVVKNMIAKNVNPGLIYMENSYLMLNNSFADHITSNGFGTCLYGYESTMILNFIEFHNYFPNCFYLTESVFILNNSLINNSFTKIATTIMESCNFIHIESSIFSNNHGGCLLLQFQSSNQNDFIIKKCKFINNSAIFNGGAIQIQDVNLIINDSVFIYNKAGYGGAIYYKTSTYDYKLQIHNTNFTKNTALMEGGAIKSTYNIPYIASNVFFSENYASFYGNNIASYPVRMKYSVIKKLNGIF